jgi:uncharacterized OB-fold protein
MKMSLFTNDKKAPKAWYGKLPVTSRYTFGIAGEKFFRTIQKEGKILGTRCQKCERTYVPGTMFCERCLGKLGEWVDVGTVGTVKTFTLLYQDYDGSPREIPEVIAFIAFGDGGIIHRLGAVPLEKIAIGMEVEAVFKPEADREGSILDIVYFKPANEIEP